MHKQHPLLAKPSPVIIEEMQHAGGGYGFNGSLARGGGPLVPSTHLSRQQSYAADMAYHYGGHGGYGAPMPGGHTQQPLQHEYTPQHSLGGSMQRQAGGTQQRHTMGQQAGQQQRKAKQQPASAFAAHSGRGDPMTTFASRAAPGSMLPSPAGVLAPPLDPYAHVQPRYAQAAAMYVAKETSRARGGAGGSPKAGKGSKAGGKTDRFAESTKNAAMISAMADRWM